MLHVDEHDNGGGGRFYKKIGLCEYHLFHVGIWVVVSYATYVDEKPETLIEYV